jgi:methanogenic corrinoid protein MtbC1
MLIQSAQDLLHNKRELASRTRRRLSTEWLDFGDNERLELVYDMEMHLAFLGEAIRLSAPRLFSEYATWSAQLLQTSGGDVTRFEGCLDALGAVLSEAGSGPWLVEAHRVLDHARVRLQADTVYAESHLHDDNPHRSLAAGFLNACLHMRRSEALDIVQDAVKAGVPVEQVYIDVITPAMRELGRMWHLNLVTVGQEHYCTAVAQMVMAQLFPLIFDGERAAAGRVVSVCAAGELHEIGARMVADLFEMHGWDTVFLGADVPASSVVDTLVETDADVLAISVTLAANLGFVSDLIEAMRRDPACDEIKVLVGGAAFEVEPNLWERIGADGWAPDAAQAMALAEKWRR